MLYQLSYSPNELDDLASGFEGYTSAVRTKRTCTLNAETWQEDNGKKPGSPPWKTTETPDRVRIIGGA
jgi:hypothetical protein